MICQRCRTSILSRLHQHHPVVWSASSAARQFPLQRTQFRNYSDGKPSTAPSPPPQPRQPVAGDITVPSAISSATPGISQPFSTPQEVHSEATPEEPTKPAPTQVASSCPAGTKLNGLNFYKNKPELFALEDSEYPDWLWTLLDNSSKKQAGTPSKGADLSSMNRKQRKRYEKKAAARAATLPPKIPVHHQATDITAAQYNQTEQGAGDFLEQTAEGLEKRTEITRSSREARRKGIREANFLKGL